MPPAKSSNFISLAEVKVPAVQATVSSSVDEKTPSKVHPQFAISKLPKLIKPLRIEAETEPPVMVTFVKVATPVFNIFALPSTKAIAPHQEFPVSSV